MATSAAKKAPSFFAEMSRSMGKLKFATAGYNKYGLLRDDILFVSPPVEEAIRRLPQNIKDERTYRILRAVQQSLQHTILPKEQWTTFEQDVFYLQPYIEEVERENAEKAEWAAK